MTMRILVCGGRDFTNERFAFAALDRAHAEWTITCIIEGGARGADQFGADWARLNGVASCHCPADWAKHGRSAGFVRNESMLLTERPDIVLAFPGGRGTAHMVRIALSAGFTVWQPGGGT